MTNIKYTLSDILSKNNLQRFNPEIDKDNGLILITGYAHTGKTETYYAVMNEITNINQRTTSVEEKLKYEISNVAHFNGSTSTHTYAEIIKGCLRMRPWHVCVDEIRNLDTAETVFSAASTGHLVLATIPSEKAKDAAKVLFNLGVDSKTVAKNLNAVIAQVLVRQLCECKESYTPSAAELLEVGFTINRNPWEPGDKLPSLYQPRNGGCEQCLFSGFKKTPLAVAEVMLVNEEIKTLLEQQEKEELIHAAAVREGMIPMIEDGWEKVAAGITTIPEILRAIRC